MARKSWNDSGGAHLDKPERLRTRAGARVLLILLDRREDVVALPPAPPSY